MFVNIIGKYNHRYEIWRYILTHNNHQPLWKSQNIRCEHCGSICDKSNIHQLFECDKLDYERKVSLILRIATYMHTFRASLLKEVG